MKLLTNAVVLALMLASSMATRAQDRLYAIVNYMHVPEDQREADYLALEKLWQRLHQKAVDTGFCRGWTLYRVENGGRNQFVTVEFFDSLDKYANRWPDSIRAGLYTSEENSTMRQTGDRRILTHSEIWELEASTLKSGAEPDSLPVHVNFMQPLPGRVGDYYNLERNLYQKIHNARIAAGQMRSWQLLSRMSPGGADGEFRFVTLDVFPEKGPSWDSKIARAALTNEEWEKMPKKLGDLRTLVREEVWHPLLRTTAAKKP